MNQKLRMNKQAIRVFLRTEVWTDEKLCALLAHAQDKLSIWSCCCLIGTANADHALKGRQLFGSTTWEGWGHYGKAICLPLAQQAQEAFCALGGNPLSIPTTADPPFADEKRRRLIRPIIRAELRRRQRIREAAGRADRETAIVELAAHPNAVNPQSPESAQKEGVR